ncbi:hypothetical protein FW755_01575 [Lonepinella koalarum]|uniref:Fibronectin type III domain protein n=1 Tax=Lonepinella koalarum TaxID=53417 RepID=A0A4R1KYR0_9PAST|nr:hypothetical protein [Lonepinella koalarum]TCK70584.1 fibronectin type III domain protein [Lonepinella koalarum]TFJ90036.1 hypothetical protein E0709_05165 [Lonepinella koalarum]TYG33872.1 hypothetical protein FW755_01575 [Lonepinella koalarum]
MLKAIFYCPTAKHKTCNALGELGQNVILLINTGDLIDLSFLSQIGVNIKVQNTGNRSGKEVVQVYATLPNIQGIQRQPKKLVAFAKSQNLSPQASKILALTVNVADLARFDPSQTVWVIDAGYYGLSVGNSSTDLQNIATRTNKFCPILVARITKSVGTLPFTAELSIRTNCWLKKITNRINRIAI